MDVAMSLKSGRYIKAIDAGYESSKDKLLVCPECGEPVYFRIREQPYYTPYFSHYKEKVSNNCSLRVFGANFDLPSNYLKGLRRGQLVDKFVNEFRVQIYEMFGDYKDLLVDIISGEKYQIIKNNGAMEYAGALLDFEFSGVFTNEVSDGDYRYVEDGLHDVCIFLDSGYGESVVHFLEVAALLLLNLVHDDVIDDDLGVTRYVSGNESALFILNEEKVRNIYEHKPFLKFNHKNKQFTINIVFGIVVLIISKWRIPHNSPELIMLADIIESNGQDDPKNPDEQPANPEGGNYRFWRSSDIFVPSKENMYKYRKSGDKKEVLLTPTEEMDNNEKIRVMHLCRYGKTLGYPSVGLDAKKDLIRWVGSGYGIESAIFIAGFCYKMDYLNLIPESAS